MQSTNDRRVLSVLYNFTEPLERKVASTVCACLLRRGRVHDRNIAIAVVLLLTFENMIEFTMYGVHEEVLSLASLRCTTCASDGNDM